MFPAALRKDAERANVCPDDSPVAPGFNELKNRNMEKDPKRSPAQIVISKEEAVFWMDGQGRWHNQHGPFAHKKIINHFNAAIRKDQQGYFVAQNHGGIDEKVYFKHAETALFATEVFWGNPVQMLLNTGERMDLVPGLLFIRNDQLFHRKGDEIVKFSERALQNIAMHMDFSENAYSIFMHGVRHIIPADTDD